MDTIEANGHKRFCAACKNPLPAGSRRTYCSPACKSAAWKHEHRDDTDREVIPRKVPIAPQAITERACPHCGEPVVIVSLLTTPQAARLDTPGEHRKN